MAMVADDGKGRDLLMLPLDQIPMWLATIHVNRVAEPLREKRSETPGSRNHSASLSQPVVPHAESRTQTRRHRFELGQRAVSTANVRTL